MNITPLYEFDINDRDLLKRYWESYHAQLIPISHVKELRIMQQKFTNNKNYDKYELFIPNNIK